MLSFQRQGLNALSSVAPTAHQVYDLIVRRFFKYFYPPAVYQKVAIVSSIKEEERFFSPTLKYWRGILKVAGVPKGEYCKGKPEAA